MIGKNDYITPNSLAAGKQDKKGKFAYVVESYDEPVSMTKGYIDIRSPLIFASGAGNLKHFKKLIKIINPNSICVIWINSYASNGIGRLIVKNGCPCSP